MSMVEGVVGSVNAILKTLECAICLELLKTPVTIGCGHFFCKFCITEVLKSNYRSPCPLCKRPFTRRSIQEAQQRQSVIQAAKELADVCVIFTGVNFFPKEISDAEVKSNSRSSLTGSRKSTTVQESCSSSSSKKRKSHESETSGANFDADLSADKAKEKIRKSVASDVEDSVCVSIEDEIIPSTSKRHRQSRADSDDDFDFPPVEEILQSKLSTSNEKRKSDDMKCSKNNSKQFPVVLIQKATVSEINSECNPRKTDEKDLSVIPDTNVPISATVSNMPSEKIDADITLSNESKRGKVLKAKGKIPLNNRGSRFRSRLCNKNEKNALTNKTNQLNHKSFEDKAKNAEKVDEYEFNAEELVKENKEMEVELFISPAKCVAKKDNVELLLSPSTSKGRQMSRKRLSKLPSKNDKNNAQTSNSSIEEDILISNLNEVENFQLEISNCASKSSSIAISSDSNEKECYNLKEINLPPIDKTSATELVTKPQKESLQLDEITDTAVSVQTVASPEASKVDLLMKSPGWSRVKQVGKDFRVRKFSRLHVEKNASNSCPSEVVAMDLDSVPNELLTEPVHDKKMMKMSDPVAGDSEKNDSCNKEKMKLLELASNMENKNVKNAVDSSVELKSCSNTSESNKVSIGNEDIDDECCLNDEVNEIPTLINETENNAGQIDIDCDDQVTRFPSPLYEMSSGKDNETCKFPIASIKELPLPNFKSAEKIKAVENEIASSVISDCYNNKNLTNLPISANIKNISLANTLLTPHAQTDANECIEGCNPIDVSENIHTSVFNAGANYEGESMEVDGVENVRINNDVNSHFPSIGDNHPKSNDLHHNYLTENPLGKQNIGNIMDTPKLVKGKESLFKYDVVGTSMDQDKNVYYAEHAQQTSQRLLDYCENSRQPKALFAPVSLCPAVMAPNAMLKHNDLYEKNDSPFNQVERFNANMFKPSSTERTKVIKRTCLTLDEIQEVFANSNASGNPETICSLPFLFGDFRLNVCVSEETLNISVLKVVESDSFRGLQSKGKTVLVSEKNIQTSNSNTPVPSPTTILPSSNVESESSQPENRQKGGVEVKTANPFPFLSEYFSDSESTEQVGAKEPPFDDSEVFPFVKPVNNASEINGKQKENMVCEDVADESAMPQICMAAYNSVDALDNLPATQPYEGNVSSNYNLPDGNEVLFCEAAIAKKAVSLNEDKMSIADRSLEKLSGSPDLTKNDAKSKKFVRENSMSSNAEKSTNFSDKTSLFKCTATATKCPTKEKVSKSPVSSKNHLDSKNVMNEKSLQITSEKSSNSAASLSTVNNIFPKNISLFDNTATLKSYQEIFDDSEGFSSDPDMAFAMELVAPLKDIAEKLKSSGNKEKSFQHGVSYSSKEKNPMETFQELILSKHKDSFKNSNVGQKPSRLSLKSKRSSKKFKRIKTYESDDDSDVSESSKNESILSNISRSKNVKKTVNDKPEEMSKTENLKNSSPKHNSKAASPNDQNMKSHDMPCESLQDNSTFNSCFSEDMTNNSNDIAMEIEDLDKKILSVVEKLKQCGHDDLLKQEKQKQTLEKDLSKLLDKDKDCQSSCDSEDSIDIFSQSVPPTPPDVTANNNDSAFKASIYSKK